MVSTSLNKLPFVLFQVKEGLYAVGAENVREIVILPKVVSLPNVPPEIRGVINLRGKVMPLIDLRTMLGLPSAAAELDGLIQLLSDREQDHHNWLKELEACVRERRPFKLARDPHACKFGVWYDRYQSDNSLLNMALKKMDDPHRIIHACADTILRLAECGDQDSALRLLAERRNQELAELSRLFDDSRKILREHHRELAVVLCRGKSRFAVSIDRVEAVECIPESDIEPMPAAMAGAGEKRPWRIGKRSKTNQTILLLDEDFFFSVEAVNAEFSRVVSTS
jgi:purine-binding chemotaxis protein CheW